MKKKLTIGLLCMSIIAGLTGCGSSESFSGYKGYDSVSQSYSNDAGFYTDSEGYSGNMDYTGTNISGDLVDYSYTLGSRGYVKEKETALNFYEDVQTFVNDNGGYIDNVNNTFRTNDLDEDYFYYSGDFIKNSAEGCVSFNVQIEEQYVEDVINMFDEFCKENDFSVTQFNQYATNYKSYDVVDEYDDDGWYHGDKITQEDLDKQLAYTSIDISMNYSIKRSAGETFGLRVRSLFHEFMDKCGDIIGILIWMIVFAFVIMFVIILPSVKIFKKSMFKFNKKHPEYNVPKKIMIDDTNDNASAETNVDVK